jgi:hypothetical protein
MTNDESRLRLADYLSHMLEAVRLARAFLSRSWPKISTDPLLNAAKQEAAA